MYINNKNIKNLLSFWLIIMFVLVSSIIIVGGLTRLTDSGLSITKWELFKGFLPPLSNTEWIAYFNSYKEIPEYNLQNFNMSLEEFKIIFWWEWAHRFLARMVGIIFFIPLLYFIFILGFKKTKPYIFIFILICIQGLIGWYMVMSGLINNVDVSHFRLSLHLTTAFIILTMILWQILNLLINFNSKDKTIRFKLPEIFISLIFLQIIIGAFVSGMDAGKIYNSWPLMGTSFFPNDNNLYNLFKIKAFSDPSLVQFMHRNLAYVILAVYLVTLYVIISNKLVRFNQTILILGLILFLQIVLGILTIISGAQMFVASMHQISSILLVSFSVYLLFINTKKN